jgi:hypothetical protein
VTFFYVYKSSFYINEKLQMEGMCKVGAEGNTSVSGKKCDEIYIMKNFIIWTSHKYFWDEEIKRADMGRACSTHGRRDN